MTPSDEPNDKGVDLPGGPEPSRRRHFGLHRPHLGPIRPVRTLPGRLLRLLHANRGLVVVMVLVAGFGSVATIGGFMSLKFSESAGFCSTCHTMTPEIKAYKTSPHREVHCAECHVGPGVRGFVKAKFNGAKQTIQVITGKFPKPIPPPDHAMLPDVKDTCMRCHSLDEINADGGPMKLVFRPRYRDDRSSTRDLVAVVLRPAGLGEETGTRGVHWHVDQKVEFTRADELARKIDWVGVTFKNGKKKEFITRKQVGVSVNVRQDIDRLKRTETTRRMDCIECHNRIGHEIPSPDEAVDKSIASGKISRDLPYIKREAVKRLNANYPSTEAADRAIAGIRKKYAAKYPLVLKMRGQELNGAIDELQRIYRLVATPEMKTTAANYPNNLGHKTSRGCFRCHDGDHYRVVKGRVTSETIPSACATCHTFPQVGSKITGTSILGEPTDHKAKLWVFDHKNKVSKLDPAGTSCGACHTSTYCSNCHKSGALKVKHNEMLYRHPEVIANAGIKACSYCHQPVSCAKCHRNPVLKSPVRFFGDAQSDSRTPNRLRGGG